MLGDLAIPFPRAPFVVAMSIVGVCLGSLPSLAAVALVDAPHSEATSFAELTTQAEAHRAAGAHAESARAFAAAYAALTKDEQGGLKGEITVANSVEDFRLAQAQEPEAIELLEEEATLLLELADHPARHTDMPPDLLEELERVKGRIEEHRRARKAAQTEDEREARELTRAEEQRRLPRGPALAVRGMGQGRAHDEPEPLERGSRSTQRADIAILSVGLASTVGGSALMAGGAWSLGNVDGRSDELLAAVAGSDGGTPEMRDGLRADIEAWRHRWRGIGTGLVVGGSILTAAGLGLTTWGIVRVLRGKRGSGRARVVWPMLAAHGVGASIAGRY